MAGEPQKPNLRVASVQLPPSEAGPRPVPTPGPGRSTADPRTPTRRELAQRAQRASMVAGAAGAAAPAPAAAARMTPAQCAQAWARVMADTDRVLAAGSTPATNPRGEDPKIVRNRAISAEYARLSAANPSAMRWAGLASVVSTQGGCAMRDAQVAVNRSGAALGAARGLHNAVDRIPDAAKYLPGIGPIVTAAEGAARTALAGASELNRLTTGTQRALYDTNEEIFKDIYPAVRMYNDHGIAGIRPASQGGCGDGRPDPARRGGAPMGVAPALRTALGRIDQGVRAGGAAGEQLVRSGSRALADYEQTSIVQAKIWDRNRDAADALSLNQTATTLDESLARRAEQIPLVGDEIASGIRSVGKVARDGMYHLMRARRTSFALTTECLPPDAPGEIPFRGDFRTAEARVDYYDDLMAQYRRMQGDGRAAAMGSTIVGRDPSPPAPGRLPRVHGR